MKFLIFALIYYPSSDLIYFRVSVEKERFFHEQINVYKYFVRADVYKRFLNMEKKE